MVTEEKIWEYLDGSLNESERGEVAYAIANDASVAALFNELNAINSLLASQYTDQPSMAFTENVMRSVRPRFEYTPPIKLSLMPLLVSAFPFLLVLTIVSVMLLNSHSNMSYSYHINTHFINVTKLLFILIDSVLLMLFIEQWLDSKRNRIV